MMEKKVKDAIRSCSVTLAKNKKQTVMTDEQRSIMLR